MHWFKKKMKMLYLQVYNVVIFRKFVAVNIEKGFFPNQSAFRDVNKNGTTSLALQDVDIYSRIQSEPKLE